MTKTRLFLAAMLTVMFAAAQAQDTPVDRTKYPDYSDVINPDEGFYTYGRGPQLNKKGRKAAPVAQRPDHLDNSSLLYFPPVFNQAGGSCGSASRISYMFTYELNAYRGLNGKDSKNYYPSHFVWLLTNGNSGKDQFVQFVGVPSAKTYGGQTYSTLFGNQDTGQNDFGWMTGYDKWFEAMHNRMYQPSHIPADVGTEEGREYLKNWLWNHNGDSDFHAGGIAGIGVASGGDWKSIPSSTTNNALGVNGKYYVNKWGVQVDHALTIVGYDDRIEFDLDGNGVVGEKDKDEVGAWIVVNSWGAGWCNSGFIYCPYKHAVTAFKSDGTSNGIFYAPEIYRVRKDYRPERTIKLKMDYSHRSEIALSAGISTNLDATEPEVTTPFHHFRYAGDGKNGNTNPAPETPMLGRWADGNLHTEPMEFGYDLTDLTASANRNRAIKYFFIVETKSWAKGSGHIYQASIMDYKLDHEGVEIPFDCSDQSPVEIKSAGAKTIISVVVYGDGYINPSNLKMTDDVLSWQAPVTTGAPVKEYHVYVDSKKVAETKSLSYNVAGTNGSQYGVKAVFTDGGESQLVTINAPVEKAATNVVYTFDHSGFNIPDVFKQYFDQATIEFYIRPTTLANWNQSAGPGWGSFMMHANTDGTFTVGWDTSNRINSSAKLKVDTWTHVAVVVNGEKMSCYINGSSAGSITSSSYRGIGGFGDLTFTANKGSNAFVDARFDEVRIWNYARTARQISNNYAREFSGPMLPDGLLAYFKGDTFAHDGKIYMRDVAGGHNAEILNTNAGSIEDKTLKLNNPVESATVSINKNYGDVYPNMPVTLSATRSTSIPSITWSCPELGIEGLEVATPTFLFPSAGEYTVKVEGTSFSGTYKSKEEVITVLPTPAIDASFRTAKDIVPAGEHVTLTPTTPVMGYTYKWSMPGSRTPETASVNAGVTYDTKGKYNVTLTVIAPDGTSASSTQQIEVTQVAPRTAFSVSPSIILKGEKAYLTDESKMGPTSWLWNVQSSAQEYIVNGQHTSITPAKAGIYDVSLTTANEVGEHTEVMKQALYVCNADSKNGLSFIGTSNGAVTAKSPFGADHGSFTIEFWMESTGCAGYCNGIGDTYETMKVCCTSNSALCVWIGDRDIVSNKNFIPATGWHHYAVTFDARTGNVFFYRDGISDGGQWSGKFSWPAPSQFVIGGSDMPFMGRIDELRVWGKAFTADEVQKYCTGPIENVAKAEKEDNLLLYYNFNHSSGNVIDQTSKGNDGVRTGFGPDGDAWGLSQGVFALCFDSKGSNDISSQYLTNYQKPFAHSSKRVNTSQSARFYELTGWQLENTVTSGSTVTGAHVDTQKSNCFTSTATWDGFSTLTNHKAFQVIELPAGTYTFTVEYDDTYEGQCGDSYLVAAAGTTLPDTKQLGNAIASKKMQPKPNATSNSLSFSLDEPTRIALGLLINQQDKICMTIKRFRLESSSSVVTMNANGDVPDSITEAKDKPKQDVRNAGIYDLQGRRIATPTRPGLYIVNGKKVVVK